MILDAQGKHVKRLTNEIHKCYKRACERNTVSLPSRSAQPHRRSYGRVGNFTWFTIQVSIPRPSHIF